MHKNACKREKTDLLMQKTFSCQKIQRSGILKICHTDSLHALIKIILFRIYFDF